MRYLGKNVPNVTKLPIWLLKNLRAIKVTVAPLFIVTSVPIVMEVVPTHSQVVFEANVTSVSITVFPEQSGQGGEKNSYAPRSTLNELC